MYPKNCSHISISIETVARKNMKNMFILRDYDIKLYKVGR